MYPKPVHNTVTTHKVISLIISRLIKSRANISREESHKTPPTAIPQPSREAYTDHF